MPYGKILEGLKRPALLSNGSGWQSSPAGKGGMIRRDPSLDYAGFAQGMSSELAGRRFQAARLGEAPEANALGGLQDYWNNELATSPLQLQRQELDANRAADLTAQRAGFDAEPWGGKTLSPSQAAGRWGREQQELARDIPILTAQARADTAVAQARAQAEGAVQRERVAQAGKMDQLRELFRAAGGGETGSPGATGPDGRVLTQLGGGGLPSMRWSQARQPQGMAQLWREFADASWGYGDDPKNAGNVARLNAARAAIINQLPYDDETKTLALDILQDPELSGMELPQIQEWFGPEEEWDPNELSQLDTILRMLRFSGGQK